LRSGLLTPVSDEYEVVGIAASGEEAVKLAEESRPDLILIDIKLSARTMVVAWMERVMMDGNILNASPVARRFR